MKKFKKILSIRKKKKHSDTVLFTKNKSCFNKIDCNFVATFVLNQINEYIFFGSCPELLSDFSQLKDKNINHVINVLTPIEKISFKFNSKKTCNTYNKLKIKQ